MNFVEPLHYYSLNEQPSAKVRMVHSILAHRTGGLADLPLTSLLQEEIPH